MLTSNRFILTTCLMLSLILSGCLQSPKSIFENRLDNYLTEVSTSLDLIKERPNDSELAKQLFTASLISYNKLAAIPPQMQAIKVAGVPLNKSIRATSDVFNELSAAMLSLELCDPRETDKIKEYQSKIDSLIDSGQIRHRNIRTAVDEFD